MSGMAAVTDNSSNNNVRIDSFTKEKINEITRIGSMKTAVPLGVATRTNL